MTVTRRSMLQGSIAAAGAAAAPVLAAPATGEIERWGLFETVMDGPSSGNPFDEVQLHAVFESDGKSVKVPGFYDGDGVYRIRFSPPTLGAWRWRSVSNARALDGRSGEVRCVAPGPGNRGPVRVTADGYHFAHADCSAQE